MGKVEVIIFRPGEPIRARTHMECREQTKIQYRTTRQSILRCQKRKGNLP
jgi:hypothetical protein